MGTKSVVGVNKSKGKRKRTQPSNYGSLTLPLDHAFSLSF